MEAEHHFLLPRTLCHAGDVALVRELAQADAADPELAVDGAGAPAAVAPGVLADGVPRLALRLCDLRLLSQRYASKGD
jgi:hypothetical protein